MMENFEIYIQHGVSQFDVNLIGKMQRSELHRHSVFWKPLHVLRPHSRSPDAEGCVLRLTWRKAKNAQNNQENTYVNLRGEKEEEKDETTKNFSYISLLLPLPHPQKINYPKRMSK